MRTSPVDDNFDQLKFAIAILLRDNKPTSTEATYIHIEASKTLDGCAAHINGSRDILVKAIALVLDNEESIRLLIMEAFKIHMLRRLAQQIKDGDKG